MYLAQQPLTDTEIPPRRRKFRRYEIQCRARILIGKRHYAGYLHNISRGGAKLRTISPIRKIGTVMLRLPDLPPLRCRLRWNDSYHAGVMFEMPISAAELQLWAATRSAIREGHEPDSDLAEMIELSD